MTEISDTDGNHDGEREMSSNVSCTRNILHEELGTDIHVEHETNQKDNEDSLHSEHTLV